MTIGNNSWGESKMPANMYECCGEQPTHIFIYENQEIYTICARHFNSIAHRLDVKNIIDYKTGEKLLPSDIFGEQEIGTVS